MTKEQKGRFLIDARLIDTEPNAVAEMLRKIACIPVRAEMLYCSNKIEYYAISPRFKEVKPNQVIPEYNISVTKNEQGQVKSVNVELIDILDR